MGERTVRLHHVDNGYNKRDTWGRNACVVVWWHAAYLVRSCYRWETTVGCFGTRRISDVTLLTGGAGFGNKG